MIWLWKTSSCDANNVGRADLVGILESLTAPGCGQAAVRPTGGADIARQIS